MFVTPERAVITRLSVTIVQQIADAESQLAQLPQDSPERDEVYRRLDKLHQVTNHFNHLMDMLGEQRLATSAPHFVVGIRDAAENRQ